MRTCGECGRECSDRAAFCPHCGAQLGVAGQAPKGPVLASRGVPLWQKVLASGLLAAGVVSCLSKPEKSASEGISVGDAMYLCQQSFKRASKDPERAEVPVVLPVLSGDEIGFSWGHSTKMLRLRNGLGLEVASSGYCAVSKAGKRVVALTLNGQSLI